MELSEFERSVLERIVAGDTDEKALREQLSRATVRGRWYSGVGLVVSLELPDEVPRADPARINLPQRPDFVLKHPDVPNNAMAIAFLKSGVLDNLECVTFTGDDWPRDESLFEFVPAVIHHG
jgi:hypothetical protein